MTIAISIRVGEGLVYAADSTSSLFETVGGVSRLAQSFHHAQKLMQLGDYPIGIMTYGVGLLGTRNLESLVAEFDAGLTPFELLGEQYSVEATANGLKDFLLGKYAVAYPPPPPALPEVQPPDERPWMGVVVDGYSSGEFYPDEFLISFPAGTVERVRPGQQAGFGVLWWGVTAPAVLEWMTAKGVEQTTAVQLYEELREQYGWNILFDGMPLQDAIDLAVYFANVTIGHSRFVVGPPVVCGGHVDVATITHRGFSWIRQKRNAVKADSVFF